MNRVFTLLISSFIVCFGKTTIITKSLVLGPLELYHLLVALPYQLPSTPCKILDFLRLTLPWTHPVLNPIFYSFIGMELHISQP